MEFGSDEWINYALKLEIERTSAPPKPLGDDELRHVKFAQGKRQLRQTAEQLEAMREQRDKLFFNAGRHAAGARDEVAVVASRVVDAIMESED